MPTGIIIKEHIMPVWKIDGVEDVIGLCVIALIFMTGVVIVLLARKIKVSHGSSTESVEVTSKDDGAGNTSTKTTVEQSPRPYYVLEQLLPAVLALVKIQPLLIKAGKKQNAALRELGANGSTVESDSHFDEAQACLDNLLTDSLGACK
jgi:hypothetical protein